MLMSSGWTSNLLIEDVTRKHVGAFRLSEFGFRV